MKLFLLSTIGVTVLCLAPALQAGGGLTTESGVYTKDQAKSGKKLYETHCLMCHDNKYFKPVLKRWHGQDLAVFYDVMRSSMPESNPGGLLDSQYLDILAYIFSRSRYPAAEEPLTLETVGMIRIEDP